MNPTNPSKPNRDQEKALTPDKLRNDKARWKDRDQPDQSDDNLPDPERDYPDARDSVPR